MIYYSIEPEVAGGLGKNTILQNQSHPPNVINLHYEFEGWSGDVLLETFPCYILKKNVGDELIRLKLSGFNLKKVEISKTAEFEEANPEIALPEFYWLQVIGSPGTDDFGVSPDFKLVVSENAFNILNEHGLNNAIVERVVNS